MVYGGEGPRWIAHTKLANSKLLESLGARYLVDEMQAYKELRLAGGQLTNRVLIPDLL